MHLSFIIFVIVFLFNGIAIADSNLNILHPETLHIVGDSQACGAGLIKGKVEELKNWSQVKVTCKGGTRIQYWHSKIDEVGLKKGDFVVVYLGSNDWETSVNAKPLLLKLKDTHCVFVGPPLIRNKNGVADIIKKQVELDGTCRYLDSRKLNLKQPDGVHTSEPIRWLLAAIKLF